MRVKMSGKGAAFRIDVILQSVNELRQGLLCKIKYVYIPYMLS